MNIAETITREGYILLHGYMQQANSENAFSKVGSLDTVEGIATIQALTPKDVNQSEPNTYSGNFGTSEFPLHSDLAHWCVPPRYLALRCVRGTPDVKTHLLLSDALISNIGIDRLERALVQPRRPVNKAKHLISILDQHPFIAERIFRWDAIYLKPVTKHSKDIFQRMKDILTSARPLDVCLSNPGDTLIIDNWRCLHGRSATPPSARNRHIDRAYLKEIHQS